MNPQLKKYAPIGLYLSLLAILVAGGFYIVQKSFTLPIQISLGVAVLGIAAFALLDPERVRTSLSGRQARYGSNALVMTIAFIGILVVINYIGYKNAPRWDLTQDQVNSLAPESIKTLASLKQPVMAYAYYTSRASDTNTARQLLENFKNKSINEFDFKFLDPEANPVQAQADHVTQDSTVVLKMDGRQELVTSPTEQDITSALIRLANPGKRTVYFLTGHGEYDPNGSGNNAYSQVKATLTAKNYTIQTLNLLSGSEIPSDALAIIIAGPKIPLSDNEVSLIKNYLANGKALVYLSNPPALMQTPNSKDPLADYLATTWGIESGNNIVVDPNVNPPVVAVTNSYGSHPITQKLTVVTVFPTAHSISAGTAPTNISLTQLAITSDQAWGETDIQALQNNQQLSPDKSKDLMGPVSLAVAGSNSQTNARVVVIGNADFANDQNFQAYGNSDFIINSIDWAASQNNLINLTAKTPTNRVLVPPSDIITGLLLLGSVFVMPGLVIFFGITTWLQRRRRG
ncbi:MAG TPA: Gldg family protein [Anaerolineaceae bacterium]|nr:Gldg family protein [Anaerolineaceae bacterium]